MRSKNSDTSDKILEYVNKYFDINKSSPSLREIESATGISRQTVLRYLRYLNDEGILEYDGKNGSIITEHMNEITSTDIMKLPVVGRIACGDPYSESESHDGYIEFPSSLLGDTDSRYFALKTYGDSMTGAGIDEGDYVIIRQQRDARRHQIVAAIDENGCNTLKRLEYNERSGRYFLHPENSRYDDIYPYELSIQGVAVRVIKNIE